MTEATKLPTAPEDEAPDGRASGSSESTPAESVPADGGEDGLTEEAVGIDGEAVEGTDEPEETGVAEEPDLESRWRDSATSMAWQPPARRRRQRRIRLVAGLVIVVVLAAVGYGAWRLYNDEQLATARSSALSAGKADAALISTYSYKNFPEYSKKIVANSTKQFADNYTKDAGSLGTILTQYQAGSKGTVIGAGLGPGTTTGKATVYVFLNETVSNSKNPSQTERARMVVTLVRHNGHWVIANAIVE